MRAGLLLALLVLVPACALFQRHPRPPRATPEEAKGFQFPLELPAEGRQLFSGVTARAIQLAAEDFRPLGSQPHKGATPFEACLYRLDAFDVDTSPGPEGIVFVRFAFDPKACPEGGPVMDAGATYAIDVKQWRILAVE